MTESSSGSEGSNQETPKPETEHPQLGHAPGETGGDSGSGGIGDGKTGSGDGGSGDGTSESVEGGTSGGTGGGVKTEASKRRSQLYWTIAVLSALACVAFLFLHSRLDSKLSAGCCGYGFSDLQFAYTADRAGEILEKWQLGVGGTARLKLARDFLRLDYFLIAAYWLLFSSLFQLARKVVSEERFPHLKLDRDYSLWGKYGLGFRGDKTPDDKIQDMTRKAAFQRWTELSVLPTLAALCDLGENFLLGGILETGSASGRVALCVGVLASLKIGFVTIAAIPLAVVTVVRGRRFLQKQLPGAVHQELLVPPGDVIKREREYLVKRRSLVEGGLAKNYTTKTQGEDGPAEDTSERVRALGMIGVSLSGGGIRSATLNLGALEALIRLKVLPKVDYLATVSGGGYIGSLLSSLLSINSECYSDSPDGGDGQYHFANGDKAKFTTSPGEKPSDREKKPGQTPFRSEQLDHLRTHGDFLILRRRLVHRDVLRVVGTVLGGIFYHLLLFLGVLTVLAGLYMGTAQWIAGPFQAIEEAITTPVEEATEEAAETEVKTDASAREGEPKTDGETATLVKNYFQHVFGGLGNPFALAEADKPTGPLWKRVVLQVVVRIRSLDPFWKAVLIGFGVLPLSMVFISWMLWGASLPDRWFTRGSESVEENREYQSLSALFWIALIAGGAVAVYYVVREGAKSAFLLLPLGIYFGGWLTSLIVHAIVATVPLFGRNARSRYAAWKGMFHYLTVGSLVVVLFPLAILWFSSLEGYAPQAGGLVWLGGLVGSWLFSKKESENPAVAQAKKIGTKVASLSSGLRNFFLGVAVALVIGGGLLIATALIYKASADASNPVGVAFAIAGGAALFVAFLGLVLDFNRLSLHYFYRDRLVETYLQTVGPPRGTTPRNELQDHLRPQRDNAEMRIRHLHGSPEEDPSGGAPAGADPRALPERIRQGLVGEYFKRALWSLEAEKADTGPPPCQTSAPYHLVITCLNLTKSRDLKRRNRKSDHFIFSKLYCGSNTTRYVSTDHYRGGDTKLARALTLSGAAVSPAIGQRTFFAQSFATALLNIRLGQWLENPAYRNGAKSHSRENLVFWPTYLIREMLGSTNADSRLVFLSDGGHTGDNVGIVPLLQRRCRLILAFDAECDPELKFGSLNEAIRQAWVDENIKIDIDLKPIYKEGPGNSERHVAVGRIEYPDAPPTAPKAWLVVFKSSITGDESEPVNNYVRTHESFPNQTTGDLFFDDAQFEAYRSLGDHQVEMGLTQELGEALDDRDDKDDKGDQGWRKEWSEDFADLSEPGVAPPQVPAATPGGSGPGQDPKRLSNCTSSPSGSLK